MMLMRHAHFTFSITSRQTLSLFSHTPTTMGTHQEPTPCGSHLHFLAHSPLQYTSQSSTSTPPTWGSPQPPPSRCRCRVRAFI
jgi:hypothetical protein